MRLLALISATSTLLGLGPASLWGGSSQATLPTLTTAKQAHSLTSEEAARRYPVRLKGVITYYDWITDPGYAFVFVQDDSGSIFATFPKVPHLALYPGEVVSVAAVSHPGRYAPMLAESRFQHLGQASLPPSHLSSLARMLTGAEDGKWLDVKGVVLSADVLDKWRLMLDVQADVGVLRVTVMNYGSLHLASLVDSTVLLTGNCAPFFNTHRQLVGARVFVPQGSLLRVLRASHEPFSLPVRSISSLMRYAPEVGDVHRVRVHGTVTLSLPGRFVIQEGEDATMVEPAGAAKVNLGDEVDTAGLAAAGEYSPLLRRALFRRTGRRLSISPVPVVPEQVLTGSYDMRLISLEGRLVERRAGPLEQVLLISAKNSLVEAVLNGGGQASMQDLEVGSYLRITGICSVEVNQDREPKGFRIFLRSPQDVAILHAASWWSVIHTLYVLFGTLVATLVVAAWVFVLKRRVAEQTGVIWRQLAEADKLKQKAEGAYRAKSEFLANMSHEIRTPLNGVIGMTELAMSSSGTEQQEYHALIKSSGEALLVLLNDILDYSKIEAGKITLESVPFNLEELISSSIKSIAISAHKKALELTFQLDTDVPLEWVGDPIRLRQILLNLTGNAIKFTHEGEIAVRVQLDALRQGEPILHFSVRDTGVGISAEQQAKLFQPFEQADSSTTRRFGGTGLGLAISARIVQLMGGEIWIESCMGDGATFHFTAQMTKSASLMNLARATSGELMNKRVLIIDDSTTSRNILQEMTSTWKMKADVADSGIAGLKVLKQAVLDRQPIELVLLDEQMPGMKAIEVIEQTFNDRSFGNPRWILLRSFGPAASADRYQRARVSTFLHKPVSAAELQAAIFKELRNREAADPPGNTLVSPAIVPAENALRILLAEDNLVNQKVAATLLRKMGHHVTLANNGSEAVDKWSGHHFNLIFMDVQMPEMDGLEATRQIRKQELASGGHILISAMTANVMDGDRDRCLAAGMDDYISKPITRRRIDEVLDRLVFSRQ